MMLSISKGSVGIFKIEIRIFTCVLLLIVADEFCSVP